MKKLSTFFLIAAAALCYSQSAVADAGPPDVIVIEQPSYDAIEMVKSESFVPVVVKYEAVKEIIAEVPKVIATRPTNPVAYNLSPWRQVQSKYGLINERLPEQIDKKYILRSCLARNVTKPA